MRRPAARRSLLKVLANPPSRTLAVACTPSQPTPPHADVCSCSPPLLRLCGQLWHLDGLHRSVDGQGVPLPALPQEQELVRGRPAGHNALHPAPEQRHVQHRGASRVGLSCGARAAGAARGDGVRVAVDVLVWRLQACGTDSVPAPELLMWRWATADGPTRADSLSRCQLLCWPAVHTSWLSCAARAGDHGWAARYHQGPGRPGEAPACGHHDAAECGTWVREGRLGQASGGHGSVAARPHACGALCICRSSMNMHMHAQPSLHRDGCSAHKPEAADDLVGAQSMRQPPASIHAAPHAAKCCCSTLRLHGPPLIRCHSALCCLQGRHLLSSQYSHVITLQCE